MIKLIATDMDGTWLTDQKTYDQELFLQEFQIMQKKELSLLLLAEISLKIYIRDFHKWPINYST